MTSFTNTHHHCTSPYFVPIPSRTPVTSIPPASTGTAGGITSRAAVYAAATVGPSPENQPASIRIASTTSAPIQPTPHATCSTSRVRRVVRLSRGPESLMGPTVGRRPTAADRAGP
jgi:hypothetical protein